MEPLRERVAKLTDTATGSGRSAYYKCEVDDLLQAVEEDRADTIESLETSLRIRSDDLAASYAREAELREALRACFDYMLGEGHTKKCATMVSWGELTCDCGVLESAFDKARAALSVKEGKK